MKVKELMTRDIRTCLPTDSLNDAARLMWEGDCGCVPVVNDQRKVIGMITDRDVCMAAYTQGMRLMFMTVESAASKYVVSVGEEESLGRAEDLMRDGQVRRLPVVDSAGRLVGMLSISDLARHAQGHTDGLVKHIIGALVAVSQPRPQHAGAELKHEVKKGLELLQTLRDEVRVRLHLGGLDIKDQWRKLEPYLGEVEKTAGDLTEASRTAVLEAVKKLEHLRSSLAQHN